MRNNVFETLARSRPSTTEVQDAKLRQNQGPAIADAQATAEQAKGLPPVGASMRWWGQEDPEGGLLMIENGRMLAVDDHLELFFVLGTRFSKAGDAPGTFRLPDSRDRSGMGATTTHPVGTVRGSETALLIVAHLPPHAHLVSLSNTTHSHTASARTEAAHDHGGLTTDSGNHAHSGPRGGNTINNVDGNNGAQSVAGTDSMPISPHDGHKHGIPQGGGHNHVVDVDNDVHTHTASCANTGSGSAHDNLHPVIHCNYVIRVRT